MIRCWKCLSSENIRGASYSPGSGVQCDLCIREHKTGDSKGWLARRDEIVDSGQLRRAPVLDMIEND